MRVIRTEMYFDPSSIRSDHSVNPENPGIGVAWFGAGENITLGGDDVRGILSGATRVIEGIPQEDIARTFLDIALQDRPAATGEFNATVGAPLRNLRTVNYILDADIVYERSPPKAKKLKAMVRDSSVTMIGTYFGMSLADGNHPLMLLTVPAGIIIIGSAVGVSLGLQNGLNKAIDQAIKSRLKR